MISGKLRGMNFHKVFRQFSEFSEEGDRIPVPDHNQLSGQLQIV